MLCCSTDEFAFHVRSMHGQDITKGFVVEMKYKQNGKFGILKIADGDKVKSTENMRFNGNCKDGVLKLNLEKGKALYISEIIVSPVSE